MPRVCMERTSANLSMRFAIFGSNSETRMPGTLVAKRYGHDTAAAVPGDAGLIEAKALRERHPADRNQDEIGVNDLSRPAVHWLDFRLEPIA